MKNSRFSEKLKKPLAISMLAIASIMPISSANAFGIDTGAIVTAIKNAQIEDKIVQQAIDKAQQQLMQKIADEANKLTSGMQNKLNNAISGELNKITNGQVGKLMQNAGISLSTIDGTPGKVNTQQVKQQVQSLIGIDNVPGQIAAQTQIMLQNQMSDRLNVTSMLDEKPASGSCTTAQGDKCTILTRLREMDAVALNSLQATNVLSVGEYVRQGNKFNGNIISNFYEIAGTTKSNPNATALFKALTPSPSIPLGYERSADAADLNKSRWLSHVLVGQKNDVNLLLNAVALGEETQQVDALSKLAKMQIARAAIMNVHNPDLHNALNGQVRACVVRPDAQDRIGATQEQQLVHIQSLLRCNNLIQLQSRQQELESQRLLGTMLLTLLDLYAAQNQSVQKR